MENIQIQIVDQGRHQQVIDFIYSDFYPRERLQYVAGLTASTYFNLVDEIVGYLNQGVSLVAVDTCTDQLVGIAVNCILTEMDAYDHPTTIPGQRAILTYLQRLQCGHNLFDRFRKGLEIYYLGVGQQFCLRGWARKLSEQTIEIARQHGADFVQSFPTSPGTLHLFDSLGFDTLAEMKLIDHIVDGAPGFPLALPSDFARYVVKTL